MPLKVRFFVLCNFIQVMAVTPVKSAFISAVFIILFTNQCNGLFICPTQESQALLSFKEALNVSDAILSSWVKGSDCCSTWEGISCNKVTGHVEQVNLTANTNNAGQVNLNAYTNHTEQGLQSGSILSSLCNVPFLKCLILKSIGLTGNIPFCLGNLSYLQVLVLKNNRLTGKVPPAICLLTNLSYLDVSINQLGGNLPPCLGNLTSLGRLSVHYNQLTGKIPLSLNKLSLLKFLSISGNKFNGSLELTGLSSLDLLIARDFSLPEYITSSQLALPSSIKVLWLSHITISDTLFHNLAKLKFLFVSYCSLNISTSWLPQFQLAGLDLVSCSIGGRVPEWLFTQYSLERLALADDNIVGEIPSRLWENNPLLYLFNLSGNHFNGSLNIPSKSIRWMTTLDVSRNKLTGQIASAWPQDLQLLMVNDNLLTGNIPSSLCTLIHLEKLDLSNNRLKGNIPPCFANYKVIQVLNLGNNSLEGSIPHGLCSSSLIVRNNKLSGAFPPPITSCKRLQIVDIGHNRFGGDIPCSVGNLSGLQVLIMNGNRFKGSIPSEIVQLEQLQILDLSSNNISGFIPQNIASLKAMGVAREDGHILSAQLNPFHEISKYKGSKAYSWLGSIDQIVNEVPSHDELDMTVKHLNLHYPYILSTLTVIDLSNNHLNGEIPLDIGKLEGLRYLNLSINNLSGIIPPSLGDMRQLESLDLSTNRLSGNIPAEIQNATFLDCLNLSNNNLSGRIPQGGQMITFENTSYSGNPYLEGCPLPKKCFRPNFHPPTPQTDMEDRNEDDREQTVWYEIGLGLSHVAGYCFVMLLLSVRQGWRNKYFKWVDKILKFLFPCIRNKRL